jgi:hypothetical protein
VSIGARTFGAEFGNNYAAFRKALGEVEFAAYHEIKNSSVFCAGLRDQLVGAPGKYGVSFFNGDGKADKEHWRYNPNVPNYIEAASVLVFSGHGTPGTLWFPDATGPNDATLRYGRYIAQIKDMIFGEYGINYVFLYTCNFNNVEDAVIKKALQGGCHLICGYESYVFIKPAAGGTLGKALLDGKSVKDAWHFQEETWKGQNAKTTKDGKPYTAFTSVIGLEKSMGDHLPRDKNKGTFDSPDFEGETATNGILRDIKAH